MYFQRFPSTLLQFVLFMVAICGYFLLNSNSTVIKPIYTMQSSPAITNLSASDCDIPRCIGACGELLAFILEQRSASAWHVYYDEIALFLRDAGVARDAPATLVEVGTAWGGLAHHLLERLPLLRLVAVDPFLPYDPGDVQSRVLEGVQKKYAALGGSESGSELWARAMRFNMVSAFGCRYTLHHATSAVAAKEAAREPLKRFGEGIDAAFIDGDHTYQGGCRLVFNTLFT